VNLLTVRGGQPIFYMSDGKIMRLAKKIVKVYGIVPRNRKWKGPVERRGTNLINGEKMFCHGKLNYLQCGKPNVPMYRRIIVNGPAIWEGCVTRRQHRVESRYFSQKTVTVQGGYGACFCRHGTNFIEHYACRGTSLIEAGKLSRYRIFVRGTCAVSRYNLSRSQKTVTVQDFNYEQMCVSGCKNHYKFVLSAGAKAKTVTNNLPILSVLGVGV
jgi:hypothetical protein